MTADSLRPPAVSATRYVQPLREGGSLPAIVDTDAGMYVVKFRGAGQGVKSLVAEFLVGLLARAAGLPVPELALVDVPPPFGRNEPDSEIRDLLRKSNGVNVGLRYLDGAFNFDGNAAGELLPASFASELVWFDALVLNPDRTHRNPNLLVWRREPWLIDHGSALYTQHDWPGFDPARAQVSLPSARDHVLLARADDVAGADARLAERLSDDVVRDVVAWIPDALFDDPAYATDGVTPDAARTRYRDYITARLRGPRAFVTEVVEAREQALRALRAPARPRTARR